MSRRGRFIVLEGPDKSGKSTQARLLVRALRRAGLAVLHTREPGGTSFAEAIRKILLNPGHKVHPFAELFLYEAARAQHTRHKILPALNKGRIVVSERYSLATEAYQGYGRGLPLPFIRALNRAATGGLEPDLTLVLDIPEAAFASRHASRKRDRLEKEPSLFRRKVREGYRKLARARRGILLLNGNRGVAETHQAILQALRRSGAVPKPVRL